MSIDGTTAYDSRGSMVLILRLHNRFSLCILRIGGGTENLFAAYYINMSMASVPLMGTGGGTIVHNNVQAAVRAMETRTRGHTINMHRSAFHLSVCQTGILCSSWEPTPAVDRELKGDVGGSGGEGEEENRGNIHTTSCCERNAKLLTLWCLLLFHSS